MLFMEYEVLMWHVPWNTENILPFDSTFVFIGWVLIKTTLALELTFNEQIISMLHCKD